MALGQRQLRLRQGPTTGERSIRGRITRAVPFDKGHFRERRLDGREGVSCVLLRLHKVWKNPENEDEHHERTHVHNSLPTDRCLKRESCEHPCQSGLPA